MDRLTKRFEDGEIYSDEFGAVHKIKITYENGEEENVYEGKLVDKLAKYEDLEESGRLVKLPCAVGSTVWVITAPMNVSGEFEDAGKPKELYKCKLVAYSIYIGGIRLHCEYNGMTIHAYLTDNNIGIDVFLTREAAEAKLKEAKAGNGI